MRRWASALLVTAVAAGLVGVGAPAYAVDPPSPPLNPVYDLPSTWPAGTLTEEEAILRKHEIDMARSASNAKWWTQPVDLTTWKGLGKAGGAAVGGFVLGFDVGANGAGAVAMVSTVLDGEVPDWWCNSPDWYTGATIAGSFSGLNAMCPVPYATPNTDATGGPPTVSYGATTYTYNGSFTSGSVTIYCYGRSGPLLDAVYEWPIPGGGYGAATIGGGTFTPGDCYAALSVISPNWISKGSFTSPHFRLRSTTTGEVLGTMTAPSADPNRQTRCTYHFRTGSSVSSSWIDYKDSTGWPADEWSTACDTVGSGLTIEQLRDLDSVGVETRTEGGAITEIAETEVPSEMEQYQEQMSDTGTGRKALTLVKVLETGEQLNCLIDSGPCRNWYEETEGATETAGTPFRCLYGGVEVNIAECAVYRFSFSTKPGTIHDPSTGEDVNWGTGTDPNSMSPGVGPSNQTPGDQCMSQWSSAPNPIEWVFWPVKCALVWAFVPRAGKVTEAQDGMQEKIDNSVIGSVAGGLATLGQAWDAGVGCGGLPFHLEGFGVTLVHANLLASCEEPAAGTAMVVKTVLTAVIITGAFLAALRYLASVFGFMGFGQRGAASEDSGPRFS